jgi:sterol desaturase/sphingolipid hydroxylase (fatty acid hydroxylase superfamily)
VPALWRFHAVHHVDRDLDASTALRFHFGELAVSVPWRTAQVAAIGVSRDDLRLWQRALLVSILFHHSNLRLPPRVERVLGVFVVTPALHGIHHANEERIRDANWSSGLVLWDWLHGTLETHVPQEAITIGVEGYDDPDDVTLPRILTLPFRDAPALSPDRSAAP